MCGGWIDAPTRLAGLYVRWACERDVFGMGLA
jgi:hypothetical protein